MKFEILGVKDMRGKYAFGFGPSWGRGFAAFGCEPPRSPRMRRGDIKYLLLEVLKDGPKHGYDILGELENRYEGYRASPGSVYPTLQMLEEGGYITGVEIDGKKVYTITDLGLKLLEDRGDRPFEETPRRQQGVELWKSLGKLALAVTEGARSADEKTIKELADVLAKARREVYAILAES
jgi:DNA-binding PadR family transcriptional regulator